MSQVDGWPGGDEMTRSFVNVPAEAWTLYQDLTATLQYWVDAANAKSLTCSCTSPLSGCRCDRPVTGGDGLCSYCRTSCRHLRKTQ